MSELSERVSNYIASPESAHSRAGDSWAKSHGLLEECLAQLRAMEGVMRDAEAFLCDPRAGEAANAVAEKLIACLTNPQSQ